MSFWDGTDRMKIAVAGAGYVGSAMAALLAQRAAVTVVDVIPEKVERLNRRLAPVHDAGLEEFLAGTTLDLTATLDGDAAYRDADYVIIAVPTDFSEEKGAFDTGVVESVIRQALQTGTQACLVVASTVPVGFTARMARETGSRILFFPEFLRETHALDDLLSPTRLVFGFDQSDEGLREAAGRLHLLMRSCLTRDDVPCIFTGSTEAEAVKLFSNTYLALRVAFFNELDSFAMERSLDAGAIIRGVGLDPRIGSHYNNPSFGYGGYCLPKDTKEMEHDFGATGQELMSAVVRSNALRAGAVARQILQAAEKTGKPAPVIGVWRLIMKTGSDNYRASAVFNVIRELLAAGAQVLVYEPGLREGDCPGCRIAADAEAFMEQSDVIICNRYDRALDDVRDKTFTRDLFGVN